MKKKLTLKNIKHELIQTSQNIDIFRKFIKLKNS